MKKTVIVIIIILVIIILGISIVLLEINNKENITISNNTVQTSNNTNEYNEVSDSKKIFSVVNNIGIYFDTINKKNSSYYNIDDNGQEYQSVDDTEIQTRIYNLLSEEYIKENSIQETNTYQFVQDINEKVLFVPLEMKVQIQSNIEKYLVYGFIETLQNEYISDIYIIVNVDTEKNTFSIEPTDNDYKNLDEIKRQNSITSIEEKENNQISNIKINDQYLATQYMYLYKRLALARPELAYEYLDEEYRNKRFENVDNFKKFMQTAQGDIRGLTLKEYFITDNGKRYICKDAYDNVYQFSYNTNFLDYKIKLDDYTIPSQEFIDTYTQANEEEKVSLNTTKIVKMMNSRDYHGIYKLLDEGFKNNYFQEEDKFLDYMGTVFTEHYTYSIEDYTKQDVTYIQKIQLKDINDEKALYNIVTINMQLKENLDFVISLSTPILD